MDHIASRAMALTLTLSLLLPMQLAAATDDSGDGSFIPVEGREEPAFDKACREEVDLPADGSIPSGPVLTAYRDCMTLKRVTAAREAKQRKEDSRRAEQRARTKNRARFMEEHASRPLRKARQARAAQSRESIVNPTAAQTERQFHYDRSKRRVQVQKIEDSVVGSSVQAKRNRVVTACEQYSRKRKVECLRLQKEKTSE